MSILTDLDQSTINWARRYATSDMDRESLLQLLAGTSAEGQPGHDDPDMVRADLVGVASARVGLLVEIIDRLAGQVSGMAETASTAIEAQDQAERFPWVKHCDHPGCVMTGQHQHGVADADWPPTAADITAAIQARESGAQ